MLAMQLQSAGAGRVQRAERPLPRPAPGQVRLRIRACGVCRTDLHVVDDDLPTPRLPRTPGHEIVGIVDALGQGVTDLHEGDRVGVPWLGGCCGDCRFCSTGRENLCPDARYTGYGVDGGFAEACVADARFVFPIAGDVDDAEVAPWLCAGLIGYRAWNLARASVPRLQRVGLYGFGAAAHLLAQVAVADGCEVFAFTRPGDEAGARFARQLGAVWAGGSDERPPTILDAALIFAPVGSLVPTALRAVDRGGAVVCAGIHMSDIPSFPYADLWQERQVRSVANLTRDDARGFLDVAPRVPVRARVHRYPLTEANRALADLRDGAFEGAAVLVPDADGGA